MATNEGGRRGPVRVKVNEPVPPSPFLRGQIPMEYTAIEDPLCPGTWRAQPVDYEGRGFVAFFKGDMAKYEAIAFAKMKNKRDGFS